MRPQWQYYPKESGYGRKGYYETEEYHPPFRSRGYPPSRSFYRGSSYFRGSRGPRGFRGSQGFRGRGRGRFDRPAYGGFNKYESMAPFDHNPEQEEGIKPIILANTTAKKKLLGAECIYVGDIPLETTDEELKTVFSCVGNVTELFFPVNGVGIPKGFAFVKYENTTQANNGVTVLHKYRVKGKPITVKAIFHSGLGEIEKSTYVKGLLFEKEAEILRFFSHFGELYSKEIESSWPEGSVSSIDKCFSEFLTDPTFLGNLDTESGLGYRLSLENQLIMVEYSRKKETLFFQNLPPEQAFDMEEFIGYIENGQRKIVKFKYGYNRIHRKSWAFITLQNNEQAQTVFNQYQGKFFKPGYPIEIVWPSKRDRKEEGQQFKKLFTKTFHPGVNLAEVKNFFKQITLPEDSVSGKILPSLIDFF